MKGLSLTLSCKNVVSEDYGLVVLGEDGVVYPLNKEFADRIDEFKSFVELGFDREELGIDWCILEFEKVERDPRRFVYYSKGLTPQQRALIAYNWVVMHPMVKDLLERRIIHQLGPDLELEKTLNLALEAILNPAEANANELSQMVEVLQNRIDGHTLYEFSGSGNLLSTARNSLFQGARALALVALNLVLRPGKMTNYSAMDVAHPMMTALGNHGRRPSEDILRRRDQMSIDAQTGVALRVIDEMNAWDIEFEVES